MAGAAMNAITSACTTEYVIEGDWVSLVGVYDKPNNKIRLYVSVPGNILGTEAEADYTGGWSATGSFAIGRAWDGAVTNQWHGDTDHVYVAQRVWNIQEIRRFRIS